MKKKLIGQTFDYLKIIKQYSDEEVICQCVCGKKVLKDISYFKNLKTKKSCGCKVTKQELPNLYTLWKSLSKQEKLNWGKWKDFVIWSKKQGYYEVFSYHKKNRKLLYDKKNLEFGLFINKEFFNIQRLRDNRIIFDEEYYQFTTSRRLKDLIVTDTEITKRLTTQKRKHKTLPQSLFDKLT